MINAIVTPLFPTKSKSVFSRLLISDCNFQPDKIKAVDLKKKGFIKHKIKNGNIFQCRLLSVNTFPSVPLFSKDFFYYLF